MAKMIRWEYKRVSMQPAIHPGVEEMCNGLGNEGWELVSITCYGQSGNDTLYIFKRDKHWQDKEDCGQDE